MAHPFPPDQTLRHLAAARRWAPLFAASAARHRVRVEVLYAIASRETHGGQMPPLRPDWTGDGGRGRGIMQIDDRAHPAFVRSHRNDDHAAHIDYAAGLLASLLRRYDGDYVRALAAYNAGPGGVARALREGRRADYYTTERDYATDVLARAAVIRSGGRSAASAPALNWGAVGMMAGAIGVLFDPTLGALSGLGLGVLAKAQAEGRIA